MSTESAIPPAAPQPQPAPAYLPYPYPPPAPRGSPLLGCGFALSFLVNVGAGVLIVVLCMGLVMKNANPPDADGVPLPEKHHSGTRTAADKIAIITIEGPLIDGMLSYIQRQIDQAAKDSSVKAIVLRINSPGGTITASAELHKRILRLRDGDTEKGFPAKPIVVSMGAVCASGGYYIAAPAAEILAERFTMTGSVGVYATFPNIATLANNFGVTMQVIKAGDIKDAGSMFKEMSPKEQQVLQDMVDDAYVQFLDVIAQGRPKLKRDKMLERFTVTPLRPDPEAAPKKAEPYTRYLADGGVYTATKAKERGLIDAIGDVDDAVKAAAKVAGLGPHRAVRYQKPKTLSDLLLGTSVKSPSPPAQTSLMQLRAAFVPRLWYIASGHEAAGLLAAAAAQEE